MVRTTVVCSAVLVAGLVPVGSSSAATDQHVVRVLWRVGESSACYVRSKLVDPDHPTGSRFELPSEIGATKCPDGYAPVGKSPVVHRGDVVRVYAVRYNPVSFTTLTPETSVLEPTEPAAITVLASLLRVLGGAPPGERAPAIAGLPRPPQGDACRFGELPPSPAFASAEKCFAEVSAALATSDRDVDETVEPFAKSAPRLNDAVAGAPRAIASRPQPLEALRLLLDMAVRDAQLGGFPEFARRLDDALARLEREIAPVVARALVADTSWAELCSRADCGSREDLARKHESLHGLVHAVIGKLVYDDKSAVNHEAARVLKTLPADIATARRYLNELGDAAARDSAVEIAPPPPARPQSTIVITLPLQLRDEGSKTQVQRTLVLPVASEHPLVLASVGLAAVSRFGTGFDYKRLALVQQTSGNPPAVVETLAVVDDDDAVNSFPPTIWTHVRLRDAVYGSIGTTPDKNIFDNVFLGLSYHKAEWRSLITAGAVRAKGAYEEDVQAAADRFAPGGEALPGLDLSQVPIGTAWHWRFFVAWSFHPF